ncbi:TerC family protein [Paenibacillus wulumuqiensis]|uniref:TerC family protein n=1 Tax=Paenibacillus wulumuqiensis TaxID=1567107 RepID=UPI000619CC7A|nr:TerC family protein [Paenibacillus wulumuqiensis]
MDITQASFWLALLNIIFIDLILAGDNAIVIGLAARKLPQQTQKKAILYGMGGAVIIRIVATIAVIWLLQIPWLLVVGGLLLVAIAYKLLTDNEEHKEVKAGTSLWSAVWTIIVADAAMGLDNVIAVAGAANQHVGLVIIGLCISVPIVVWGSTIFIKLTNRFPWIIYVGSAVLAYTASHMITEEDRLHSVFAAHPLWKWIFIIFIIIGVLLAGYLKNRQASRRTTS